ALALADDLRRFLDHRPIQARPIGPWGRAVKWARRHPAVAGLTALVVLVAALGFAGVTWQWRQTEGQRRQTAAALEVSRRHLASNRVARADREWRAGNVRHAADLLGLCPAPLRGWEWHYLRRLCHTGLLSVEGNDATAFSPDGRLLALASGQDVQVRDGDS